MKGIGRTFWGVGAALVGGLVVTLSAQASGGNPWVGRWVSFPELVALLKTVPAGQKIWSDAVHKDPAILYKLKRGSVSITESTFSRTYTLPNAKEEITVHNQVYIEGDLSRADAVLDLAHELVHFSHREILSPYNPGIQRYQFIQSGIEGPGGELDAVVAECKAAKELEARFSNFPPQKLCDRYWKSNAIQVESIRKDFYAAGSHYREVKGKVGKMLPYLTPKAVVFRSSYADVSYPEALSREFDQTIATACQNNERKARVLASISRSPAITAEQRRLSLYRRVHCGSFIAKR